ncbi:MAG TPA: GlmU family protein [Bacteroidia bacterium]|nr:GlmU family protein [Bacteroidia bacterium]
MNITLFDDKNRINLLPLTFTRPVGDLRVGILTSTERWQKLAKQFSINATVSFKTQHYLSTLFPANYGSDNLFINGGLITGEAGGREILNLEPGTALYFQNTLAAVRLNKQEAETFSPDTYEPAQKKHLDPLQAVKIAAPHDIFMLNDKAIRWDFELLTKGRLSKKLSDTNRVLGAENVFVEESANVECAILNGTTGPIYIGEDAEVMEASAIRGPFALCEHSQLKLNTKVYGPTTVGPHSKVGGEVTRSMVMGYSNKGHDGFLGDSVLGYWCNLGADTNNSNLKNNYADVKLWDYETKRFKQTGLQFCGLIMGDHSKCGINTMFNTGTVVGICANIFGAGFPRNFVPDFAWGGSQGFETYKPDKVFETAELVYRRRGKNLTQEEKDVLNAVFEQTKEHRYWENKTAAS